MARSTSLKYTGMRRLESGARNSRSSSCFEIRHHVKVPIETARRVHRQRWLRGFIGEAEDLRGASRSCWREAWPHADHRRIGRQLSLSESVLPPDRIAAIGQEGGPSRGVTHGWLSSEIQ